MLSYAVHAAHATRTVRRRSKPTRGVAGGRVRV